MARGLGSDGLSAADRVISAGPSIELLMDLATRFYLGGQTQVEIAHGLGLDPSTVSRYLSRARAEGIVRIEISQPRSLRLDIARELAERFKLDRAVVAAGEGGVERVAADFVSTQLLNGMRIGLSWGRMLSSVIHTLPPEIVQDLDIALLHGGVGSAGDGVQGHELARHVASLYPRSQVTYLHAPLLVDSPDIKQAMLRDRSIKAATEAAASRELALVGIGALDESAPLVRYGHLSKTDRERLLAAGAVGDTCTRFFTAAGEPVRVLDDRLIAVEWEELLATPRVIAMAAGTEKVAAIGGALRSGLINVLLTDETTASRVLADT
jgi:deoxyribonucleoside regulator